MDNERFDTIIRPLGVGTTRCGALGLPAGIAGLAPDGAFSRKTAKALCATELE